MTLKNKNNQTDLMLNYPYSINEKQLLTSINAITCTKHLLNRLHGYWTSDHAPVLHWAGHGILLQGLRLSGFSPLQYLLWTERLVPSWRNCTQRTVRIWKPRLPQVFGQCSHSSDIHLDKSKWEDCWGNTAGWLIRQRGIHLRESDWNRYLDLFLKKGRIPWQETKVPSMHHLE